MSTRAVCLARAQTINQRPGTEARVWWLALAKSHVKGSSGRRPVSASRDPGSGAGRAGEGAARAGGARAEPRGQASTTGEGSDVARRERQLGTGILVAMQQGASLLGNRRHAFPGSRGFRELLGSPAEARRRSG